MASGAPSNSEVAADGSSAAGSCSQCGAPRSQGLLTCALCSMPTTKPQSNPQRVVRRVLPPLDPARLFPNAGEDEGFSTSRPNVHALTVGLALYTALLCTLMIEVVSIANGQRLGPALVTNSALTAIFVLGACTFSIETLRPVLPGPFRIEDYLLALVLALVTLGVSYLSKVVMVRFLDNPERQLESALAGVDTATWLFVLLSAAVFEEIAFRGILLGAMEPFIGPRNAVFATAVAFALLHLSAPRLPSLIAVGVVLGISRVRSGSLLPPILIHSVHNYIAFLTMGPPR